MILTLEVVGPEASSLGAVRRKVFGAEGGSIGRLPDNDWVLADPYVSGRHAIIRFIDGQFYIEDTSRNGLFVNSWDQRIHRGRPYPINSGDRILIEPYEIEAWITADERPQYGGRPPIEDPFLVPDESFPDPSTAAVPVDPLDALGLNSRPTPVPSKGVSIPELAGGSPPWSHYTPPAVEPDAPQELIPANWDDSSISIPPAVNARPSPPSSGRACACAAVADAQPDYRTSRSGPSAHLHRVVRNEPSTCDEGSDPGRLFARSLRPCHLRQLRSDHS